MMTAPITIDDVGPMPVERPGSVAELCAIVRRCADTKTAIFPVGGGTMLDYGMPPARPGIALSTAALDQVIDYPARDLTITVQAGITMRRLQETLAAENQWLPIDVPQPEKATIGGAIACDVSGPRRYGYGTLRDYVIGISIVNDRGEECRAGGRVVKNVAGYDMMKLHTGALGTLGVITQVTLKVKPRPEASRSVSVGFRRDDFQRGLQMIDAIPWQPVAWTVELRPAGDGLSTALFEGSADAVRWQVENFERHIQPPIFRRHDGERQAESVSACRFRSRIVPSRLGELIRVAQSAANDNRLDIRACPGIATAQFRLLDAEPWPLSEVRDFAELICRKSHELGGHMVIEECPTDWKRSLPVWGRPPADLALQKAVKQALDPQNVFNPGRFVTDPG